MASSHQSKKVYDPIRKKWVAATPEELVRQKILGLLIRKLGYPSHAIVVEKSLSELPHLKEKEVPARRLDLLCYEAKTFRPLLLVECKGSSIQEKMFAQVMGYNAFIKAPLVCLANDKEFLLGWKNPGQTMTFSQLPSYRKLCQEVLLPKKFQKLDL